jgi:hypothetical protein
MLNYRLGPQKSRGSIEGRKLRISGSKIWPGLLEWASTQREHTMEMQRGRLLAFRVELPLAAALHPPINAKHWSCGGLVALVLGTSTLWTQSTPACAKTAVQARTNLHLSQVLSPRNLDTPLRVVTYQNLWRSLCFSVLGSGVISERAEEQPNSLNIWAECSCLIGSLSSSKFYPCILQRVHKNENSNLKKQP